MGRYVLVMGFLSVFGLGIGVPVLHAQSYPQYRIQLVIPGAPGDAADIAARSVAERIEQNSKNLCRPHQQARGRCHRGD